MTGLGRLDAFKFGVPYGDDKQPGQKRTEENIQHKESMDYQLVLQFKGDDCLDFDALVKLEDEIQKLVEPVAEVDGHDMGSGEMNIFILTADPVATFERAKPLLSAASLLEKVGVAYRELCSGDFTVLWPASSTGDFLVA